MCYAWFTLEDFQILSDFRNVEDHENDQENLPNFNVLNAKTHTG